MARTLCLIISLMLGPALTGSAQSFRAKRPLGELSPGWYRLELPAHLQAKLQPGAADLRVWALRPDDTLEAPYLLQRQEPQIRARAAEFTLLNASRQQNTYYYTYRLPAGSRINQLALSTRRQNFDWQARVEGSLDGQQWFSLVEGVRLLGISNAYTNYHYTQIALPLTNYPYLRLALRSAEPPELSGATLTRYDTVAGAPRIQAAELSRQPAARGYSEWLVKLPRPLSISGLRLRVAQGYDYYRPMSISVLTDSIETARGWQPRFKPVYQGYLSSLEESRPKFKPIAAAYLKIRIRDQSNSPLTLTEAGVVSYPVQVLFRVEQRGEYALYYGNEQLVAPTYDLAYVINKATISPSSLRLGAEELIIASEPEGGLTNKLWLYAVLGLTAALLAYFGYRMLQE